MFIRIQIFLLLVTAPVIGFFTGLYQEKILFNFDTSLLKVEASTLSQQLQNTEKTINKVKSVSEQVYLTSRHIEDASTQHNKELAENHDKMEALLKQSEAHQQQSLSVLDKILTNILGEPIDQTFTDKVAIKVFSLEEAGYRGYMAKVKIFDPQALKLGLAHNSIRSSGQTTSQIAKDKGGILAINAGGYWRDEKGNLVTVGTTVVDGEVRSFSLNEKVSFVGFNKEGRLVGGKIESEEQLEQMQVLQGASFLPTLLKDGKKMPIPDDWANSKHPRTLIGHFENGDLLMIVIDGRRQGWSEGVTLEEAQNKLLEFNVRDAYNLDGGGSSTFFYKGEVLNKPSDGRERPVVSSFVIIP